MSLNPSILTTEVIFQNSFIDAFGRLRVSDSIGLFDGQFTYDLQPLLFEQLTSGSGTSITHDTTNRCTQISLSSSPSGSYAYMQTFEHFRYQPGKSQQIFISFNFSGSTSNSTKFVGYSDGVNGIEFQLSGSTPQIVLYSNTQNGNQIITQNDWNVDRLNGSGGSTNLSKLNLDLTKIQILVIDFQALYSGKVRVGFDIGGQTIYVHEFAHANLVSSPYLQTANLPIRCGVICNGTTTTSMKFICSAINSEAGNEENYAFRFTTSGSANVGADIRTHILSLQPSLKFNNITNRIKFKPEHIDIIVTGNQPIYWEVLVGQSLTGSSSSSINFHSAMDLVSGSLSGSGYIIVDSGYMAASNQTISSNQHLLTNRYPITLNNAGQVRDLGRITVIARSIGALGSSIEASITWKEIR